MRTFSRDDYQVADAVTDRVEEAAKGRQTVQARCGMNLTNSGDRTDPECVTDVMANGERHSYDSEWAAFFYRGYTNQQIVRLAVIIIMNIIYAALIVLLALHIGGRFPAT